jgi:putative two-component system response regulator
MARLIAIPDCFDAVTTSRAYRGALAIDTALEIIRSGSGTHFDPVLVEAFLPLAPELIRIRDEQPEEVELSLTS